jgi:hypothetical protein
MTVGLTSDPIRPFGQPKLLRKLLSTGFTGDVASDLQRSLVLVPVGGQAASPPLTVVLNWQTTLPH